MKLVDKLNIRKTYVEHVRKVIRSRFRRFRAVNNAVEMAVGGEFQAMGILMRELLIQVGLKKDDYVVDVGCGSGRLA